ncbi:uncharacterized protein I206_107856 [Kwoniella pini CBS 10737]|uniref:Auxin efflux carrier n=1 Tax=Kwoniella pini CBS 10737 TaxID=1296096 RepID=A0A1B9HYF7_9TREE|nr:uncharacterized protein I206_06187 [Kwoniella pini CBS 10737]OCF48319.1 hypothetical protein I206_06187 [Kwoniella pini CBS 10737]
MSTAGSIIYKAFMPTLKMVLCILLGFFATKKGWLTAPGAKGLGAIVIQITLPALLFSSMVSAFTPENIKAFGPLVIVAVSYQILGLFFAWCIREIFYVPIDFRWGILVSGLTSNWGNLPTAIVQTMAKEAPFNPAVDVDLGVAYIAIFIFIMNTTFWGLGVHKLCAWDFQDNRRIPDHPPLKERWSSQLELTKGKLSKWTGSRKDTRIDMESQTIPGMEMIDQTSEEHRSVLRELERNGIEPYLPPSDPHSSQEIISAHPTSSIDPNGPIRRCSLQIPQYSSDKDQSGSEPTAISEQDHESVLSPVRKPIWKKICLLFYNLPNVTKAIIISIPIATIQPLKALFAETEGWSGSKMPNGPDGNPPLAFVIETTSFLGAIAVPGALLLLGASFARLKMPKNWKDLPLGAIVALTISKMILVPIFGIFVIQAFRDHTSLFPREDKIRTFVSILLSGTPSQVIQLVVTQTYNPDGTAETLSSFLLLQYALMFILSTAIAAIALYIVER